MLKKFEYLKILCYATESIDRLNPLGKDGWQVIYTEKMPGASDKYTYLLMRDVSPEVKPAEEPSLFDRIFGKHR